MAKASDNTASFVVRFTQNIFNDDKGESEVQWRGKISHVQGGDDLNFSEFEAAIGFIQNKLSDLTIAAVDGKSEEEKEGIITKSFDIWRKMAKQTPKMLMEAIKDPKAQVSQLQEQISHVGDELSQKIELDSWRMASKSDLKTLIGKIDEISNNVANLTKKVDKLSKKK